MGHQAIVYGRIQGTKSPNPRFNVFHHYNRGVLEDRLPDKDDDWPFLTRHMFSIAELSIPFSDRGIYKSHIIHFGGSLKDDPDEERHWDLWLDKFELLLRHLVWVSAKVHIETDFRPERVYIYRSDSEALTKMRENILEMGHMCELSMTWRREQVEITDIHEDWLL